MMSADSDSRLSLVASVRHGPDWVENPDPSMRAACWPEAATLFCTEMDAAPGPKMFQPFCPPSAPMA